MLYISRHIGRDKYGVVDTDDYVETVCTYKQLYEAVMFCHLDIKGVHKHNTSIGAIEVYQNPEFISKPQTKAKLLYGVDIKLSGTDIVAITVPNKLLKEDTRIVLSQFGRSCSKYVLQMMSFPGGGKLTFVLDDKITIMNNTFSGIANIGDVFLDVTGVTNKATLEKAYFSDAIRGDPFLCSSYMIDDPDRLDFYTGMSVVYNGLGPHAASFKLSDAIRDFPGVSEKLAEHFRTKFIDLALSGVSLRKHRFCRDYIKMFFDRVDAQHLIQLSADRQFTYENVRPYGDGCYWLLKKVSTKNSRQLEHFRNFIENFEVPKDFKELYVKICKDTVDFCLKYGSDMGWC